MPKGRGLAILSGFPSDSSSKSEGGRKDARKKAEEISKRASDAREKLMAEGRDDAMKSFIKAIGSNDAKAAREALDEYFELRF